MTTNRRECALSFSGGTDSTCVAALMAKRFQKIHLLTFYDISTAHTPMPKENVERLCRKFPEVEFVHHKIATDEIIKHLSYKKYIRYLLKYRLLQNISCGYSSISWHIRTIMYCLEHNISFACDGLTREMVHLPGHMEPVIQTIRKMYLRFNIEYENPVRDWETPPDQNFLDRLIVDQHGFIFRDEEPPEEQHKTTGKYLFEEEIFPHPNVKGSSFDRGMQHDCYPFVLYNIMTFWIYLNFYSYERFCIMVNKILSEKINDFMPILDRFSSEGRLSAGRLCQSEEAV